jgi:type II secretory pathway predicted ATPase ExeA/tetratricopeptide (TPR) repeat protein
MYDSFYNLTEKPFKISTDPRFLWLGEKHQEALATLKYGLLDRNGFIVLTGDIGTGKTTLVNALIDALSENVRFAKINYSSLETDEFLTLVAKTFDPTAHICRKSELLLFFNAFLQKAHSDGKICVLIIDEAHRLSMELLEEIRLLSNVEQEGEQLLNIIFVGQNELKPMLLSPQCRALHQRITLFYEIQALAPEETLPYVAHRLKVSGAQEKVFTSGAILKIYAFSMGNPRLINILCDRAMLTGYVKEQKKIDAGIIVECAREMDLAHKKHVTLQKPVVDQWQHFKRSTPEKTAAMVKATKRMVQVAVKRLDSHRKRAVREIRDMVGIADDMVSEAARHLVAKSRKNIAPVLVAIGLAFVFLVLTLGLFRAVGVGEFQTVGSEQPGGENLLATADLQRSSQPGRKSEGENTLMASSKSVQPELFKDSYNYAKALVDRAGELMATSPLEAEILLLKATEATPDISEAFLMLGKRYTRTKEYDRAIKAYEKAVHLDPTASDAFFNLGFIYASTGKYKAAEKAFARAVQLEPPYLAKCLFNLAVVQQKLGKKEQSMANLEAAADMGPDNSKALAYLNRLRKVSADNSVERSR